MKQLKKLTHHNRKGKRWPKHIEYNRVTNSHGVHTHTHIIFMGQRHAETDDVI